MAMIGIVWPLVSLVGLVGFIWLCVIAFRRHTGWGLAVLFLSPITAIVFAIKYWQESKKPFLVYMGSCVASVALGFYMFAAIGTQMMAMAENLPADQADVVMPGMPSQAKAPTDETATAVPVAGALDPEEEAELRRAQSLRETQDDEPNDSASGATRDVTASVGSGPASDASALLGGAGTGGGNLSDLVPPGFHVVPVDQAAQHLGKNIRVVSKTGQEIRGKLTEAEPGMLLVERNLSGGTVTFEMAARDIQTLLVSYQ